MKNTRKTKTVTFRVDEKTIDLIEGLYQTKKYKSKGEIVDIAINNMLDHDIFKECLKMMIEKNDKKNS